MVGTLYKLLAKALANRLKKVMCDLINIAQNAFVEGRRIMDVSLLVNEIIDCVEKKGERNYVQTGHKKSL